MFGASIFQSADSSLAAATVVLLPVLLVAFTIYSQSPDLQSGRLPELSASSASRASSPAPSVVTGKFVGFFWGGNGTTECFFLGGETESNSNSDGFFFSIIFCIESAFFEALWKTNVEPLGDYWRISMMI